MNLCHRQKETAMSENGDRHTVDVTDVDERTSESADDDRRVFPHAIPTNRPVLFMDFDGCINQLGLPDGYPRDDDKHFVPDSHASIKAVNAINESKTYRIHWSSELVGRIRSLVEDGICSLCWLTSWQRQVKELLEKPLGLDGLTGDDEPTYVMWFYRGFSDTGAHGKLLAIEELFESGELSVPFVSVDDDSLAYIVSDVDERIDLVAKIRPDLIGKDYDELSDDDVKLLDTNGLHAEVFARGNVWWSLSHEMVTPDYIYGIDRAEWDEIESTLRKMKESML